MQYAFIAFLGLAHSLAFPDHVVRWDPPPNMVSWAQSRGRARKQRSTFTVMFSDELGASKIADWHYLEERMNELYNQERAKKEELEDDGEELNPREFVHPETGYVRTLLCLSHSLILSQSQIDAEFCH